MLFQWVVETSKLVNNMPIFVILFTIGITSYYFLNEGNIMSTFKPENYEQEVFVRFDDLFKKYGSQYNIPYKWLKAISLQESSLGENERVKSGKVSYDGLSYGLMQIAEGVGSQKEIDLKGFGGQEALNSPEYSIGVASKLLAYLYKKYNGDKRKIFLAYNQGELNTDRNKDYTDRYDKRIIKWLEYINTKEVEYGIYS